MRAVLLGGAPGIGKTTVGRHLLDRAGDGPEFVQWVDVDALWLHRPWRIDAATRTMMHANLRAVAHNALAAGIEVLLVTWVFHNAEMQRLVVDELPAGVPVTTVQLLASYEIWAARFAGDPDRPALEDVERRRYEQAQVTPADHAVGTDGATPDEVARRVGELVGIGGGG